MAFSDANLLLVLAKLESTEDVDANPGVGSGGNYLDELLVNEGAIVVGVDKQTSRHRFVSPSHTPSKPDPGRSVMPVNIPTKLMARGDNGGAPWLDTLLQMSAMSAPATGTEETSKDYWEYKPISSSQKTGTVYAYEAAAAGGTGTLKKALGTKGSFSLTFVPSASPDFAFSGTGRYTKPANAVVPTGVLPTDTKVKVENEQLTIGSYSPSWTRVVITHGNQQTDLLDGNKDKGYFGQHYTGREGTLQIQLRAEDTVTNKDFFDYLDAQDAHDDAAMDDIDFIHGDGVQSDILLHADAPYLQTLNMQIEDNIRIYDLTYLLRNNTADNEWSLKFREEQ